jgi:FkbM family methyltransferase
MNFVFDIMLNHLFVLANDLRCIFSRQRGIRKPFRIFLSYLKIKLKRKLFEVFRVKKTSESFLGIRVVFPDYGWFAHLWREIFVSENYFFQTGTSRPRIIDVGSNIGMSIIFFKLLYPDAEILAFEPDPRTFKWLLKNVEINKFRGITCHNVALGKRDGNVDFYEDPSMEGSGINSFVPNIVSGIDPKTMKKISVSCKRLSTFVAGCFDLLKIDAEGAEYEIIEEVKPKLAFFEQIFLEIHQSTGATNSPIAVLLKILAESGFRYAITTTFLSHQEFQKDSTASYAIMLDAKRINTRQSSMYSHCARHPL